MKKLVTCLAVVFIVAFSAQAAPSVKQRLSGKILLQVEQHGEAWYVNPDDGKRYFLGRPADAFQIMRTMGLGISDDDLYKIPEPGSNKTLISEEISLPERDRQVTSSEVTDAQIKITFVNELTGKKIPGHSVSCSGCLNHEISSGAETDLNGQIILEARQSSELLISKLRLDWNNYDALRNVTTGSNIVVNVTPQGISGEDEIYFPETSYEKSPSGKTQLHISYRDDSGLPMKETTVNISGPIIGSTRTHISSQTDDDGSTIIDLPINGAYRIIVNRTTNESSVSDFYQFEAPSGYNTNLILDLSKKDEMTSGTSSLRKNYQEGGMNLICVRDIDTNEPVSAVISIPFQNTLITRSVKHGDDICVEVPQGYKEVGIPANLIFKEHSVVSTDGVDENGIMYLYVQKK